MLMVFCEFDVVREFTFIEVLINQGEYLFLFPVTCNWIDNKQGFYGHLCDFTDEEWLNNEPLMSVKIINK